MCIYSTCCVLVCDEEPWNWPKPQPQPVVKDYNSNNNFLRVTRLLCNEAAMCGLMPCLLSSACCFRPLRYICMHRYVLHILTAFMNHEYSTFLLLSLPSSTTNDFSRFAPRAAAANIYHRSCSCYLLQWNNPGTLAFKSRSIQRHKRLLWPSSGWKECYPKLAYLSKRRCNKISFKYEEWERTQLDRWYGEHRG